MRGAALALVPASSSCRHCDLPAADCVHVSGTCQAVLPSGSAASWYLLGGAYSVPPILFTLAHAKTSMRRSL